MRAAVHEQRIARYVARVFRRQEQRHAADILLGLRFRLSADDGSVLKEGPRELRDPGLALDAAAYRDDPLRYEKALIDGWLEREFKALR